MKILFVSESFPPQSYGGGEISCALLAEALAKKEGIEITVLTSKVRGLRPVEVKNSVNIVRRLKTGGGRNSLFDNLNRKIHFKRSVRKEIKQLAVEHDVVHFFNITSIVETEIPSFATINSYINFCPKGNLFYKDMEVCHGCSPLKFTGCIIRSEYVGGYRLNPLLKFNPIFWTALYRDYVKRRKALKKVDHFFSLSEFITELLREENVNEGCIDNVVNIPRIEISDKKVRMAHDGVIVTYIGELVKIKGVHILIRAFNELDTNSKLVVVGDGPERESLEKMAGPKIEFLGRVDHDAIHSIYEGSDVIVVPSLWPEPLSRVLLEAAYFGKPVVATRVGGSPDVIKNGYNGLLVEPTIEDMSKKLKYIIINDEIRHTMSINMKKYRSEKLSKDKVLRRIIGSYKDHISYKGIDNR